VRGSPRPSGGPGTRPATFSALDYLKARTLILTGVAGNICVLFTANDAYMRDFQLIVPEDLVVSNLPRDNRQALDLIRTVLHADTTRSTKLDFEKLR
jgi:nicotinamidase-related amidase